MVNFKICANFGLRKENLMKYIKMIPDEINETKDQVKHLLFYQVENLKDDYEDLEEKYYNLNLDFKEKNRVGFLF